MSVSRLITAVHWYQYGPRERDGFAYYGDRDTLGLDARKMNTIQGLGWTVLTYWGRTILKNADACAKQVAEVYRQRERHSHG